MTTVEETYKLTPIQICKRIQQVKKRQSTGDPIYNEFHQRVYYDGIWSIDLDVFAVSGVIRWWVSREDKQGNHQNSLFTMYRTEDGQLRYSADYKIKKDIVTRLLKTYEYLEKANIVG